jgi:colicin import membrane protein
MKKIIIALIALFPLVMNAQNVWEKPENNSQQQQKKKKALIEKNLANEDPKYLAGAIPLLDGKIVFTLDQDVPGKSAQQIYDILYHLLNQMTKEEGQFKESQVALVNKQDHIIAARFKEWLVFQNTFLSLDRTIFNYTIIAKCSDGHANITLSRMSYQYEIDRPDTEAVETIAEDWITDENALNKKKTKLAKYTGKFRRKTIDRKDNIFETIKAELSK